MTRLRTLRRRVRRIAMGSALLMARIPALAGVARRPCPLPLEIDTAGPDTRGV